ncbi:MAG: helix-turn-helix domain-containing protein [Actinomycetota bacterium]
MERKAEVARSFGDIAERLRDERVRQGVSQRELAKRVGLSASLISQIETGRSKPSVSTLYAIVTELGISLDRLFQAKPEDGETPLAEAAATTGSGASSGTTPVVRRGERQAIELETGVRWERLATGPEDSVDFLFVVYDVGGASSDSTLMRHPGREYGYVISGRLGVKIGFQEHILDPGDSIAFDSTQPHRLWTVGNQPAHALWCVVDRGG